MMQLWSSTRFTLVLAAFVFAASTFSPSHSRADMPDAISLVDYGFKGFTLGLELGLAIGYITTGPTWEHDEWKQLVLGAGIGALGGMTLGIVVAVVDSTSHGVPAGYYLLRDAGFGVLLGAAVGATVGVLLWVNDGTSKDVVQGAAWGGVIGAGAGVLYGLIESANARPPRRGRGHDHDDEDDEEYEYEYERERGFNLGRGVHLSVGAAPTTDGAVVAAALSGRLDL
jgi:hypothetical protein